MSSVVQTGALAPRAPLRQQQRLRSLAVPVPMHNLPSFHGFRPRGADPTPLSASARSAGRTLRAKVRAPPTRCPLDTASRPPRPPNVQSSVALRQLMASQMTDCLALRRVKEGRPLASCPPALHDRLSYRTHAQAAPVQIKTLSAQPPLEHSISVSSDGQAAETRLVSSRVIQLPARKSKGRVSTAPLRASGWLSTLHSFTHYARTSHQ